jgi:hypothetical protein
MRSLIFRGVLVSLSLLPAIGAAAGAPTSVGDVTERAPTAVGVDLGVASALGLGGVTLTRRLASHLRLEGGVGLGITGVQLSLMPKLVFGGERDYFIAGAGISVTVLSDSQYVSGHPLWLNVDAMGYEHQFDSGLAFSLALGLTGGLGGGRVCLPPDGCEPQFFEDVTHYWGPQARAQLAYWF